MPHGAQEAVQHAGEGGRLDRHPGLAQPRLHRAVLARQHIEFRDVQQAGRQAAQVRAQNTTIELASYSRARV